MGVAAAATIRCQRTILLLLPDSQQPHDCQYITQSASTHSAEINELEAKGYELKLQFQAPDPPAAKALHPAPPHVIAGAGEVEVLY